MWSSYFKLNRDSYALSMSPSLIKLCFLLEDVVQVLELSIAVIYVIMLKEHDTFYLPSILQYVPSISIQ